ncbi:cupin domain-containing protein [Geodermatophilus sp. SYSU D00758]
MSHLLDGAAYSRRADQRVVGRTRFVATGGQTRGDLGVFEATLPPGGGGPGPHLHRTFSESFHVLEGRLRVLDGSTWNTAGPGDFVYVPRSGVHGFTALEDEGCRFLILFTPGAPREGYFEGMVALHEGGRTPSTEELDELAARHDQLNLRH